MEKVIGNRFSNLRTDDQNPINPEEINHQNLISQEEGAGVLREVKRIEILAIGFEAPAISLGIEDGANLLIEPPTEAKANLIHEIINLKLRRNSPGVHNWVIPLEKITLNVQVEVFHSKEEGAAGKVRQERAIRLHKGHPAR